MYTLLYLPTLSLCRSESGGGTGVPCDDARTIAPLSSGVEILFPAASILHNLNAILFDPVNSNFWFTTGLDDDKEYLSNRYSMLLAFQNSSAEKKLGKYNDYDYSQYLYHVYVSWLYPI